jgi:predicted nucleic acid-binding protein
MRIFLDTSVLIEYLKGNKFDLLERIMASDAEACINHIVLSEFLFHFLSLTSGKSPLTLKKSEEINRILAKYAPMKFLEQFTMLPMPERLGADAFHMMKKHNLLPNDSLILATCKHFKITALASYDLSDFTQACESEKIRLVSDEVFFDEMRGKV